MRFKPFMENTRFAVAQCCYVLHAALDIPGPIPSLRGHWRIHEVVEEWHSSEHHHHKGRREQREVQKNTRFLGAKNKENSETLHLG